MRKMQNDTKEIIRRYYNRLDVKYAMFQYLNGREFALISPENKGYPVRHIKINNVQGLTFWLENMGVGIRNVYNLYYSSGHYIRIPNRSGNLSKTINKDFWDSHHTFLKSRELFIDVDSKTASFEHTFLSAVLIKRFFDKYKAPYEIVFSGRGFHFKTPQYLTGIKEELNPNKEHNLYKIYFQILTELRNKYSDLIDCNVCDSRRLMKLPYSLAVYPNEIKQTFQFNSNEEFKRLKEEMLFPDYWKDKIYKRGRFIFNETGNFDKVLKVLEIDTPERL